MQAIKKTCTLRISEKPTKFIDLKELRINEMSVKVRLASVPKFAECEYHPAQIRFYEKMTELVYKALNLNSVCNFIKELIERFSINEDIEVRIMRLPSYKSRIIGVTEKGRIIDEQLHGRSWKNKNLIDIFPNCHFPDKLSKPHWSVGLRGYILNSSIRALIHELLHKSGIHDEKEVRKITEQYYRQFRRKYLKQFDKELKPILKEWKEIEKSIGLQ
ncbi:hypothetical protein J7K27_09300 [Candidatus Bathyarchaeota archaeon]|nr:hypothetical protein [Candidatus Bathyarchaeota archaeon]